MRVNLNEISKRVFTIYHPVWFFPWVIFPYWHSLFVAIRRILIITAEQVHPTPEHAATFKMTMYELGLLSGMILALVLCIYLLRRHGRDTPVEMEG